MPCLADRFFISENTGLRAQTHKIKLDDDINIDGDDIDSDDDDIASPALIKRSWATTVRKVLQSPLPKTPLGKFIRTLSSRKSKTVDCHNSKFCLFYHSRSDDDSGDILSYINVF